MLEGKGKPAVSDRGRFSKQQVAPRMPSDEIPGSSVTRGHQCHCLLCPHKERGASSFLTPRALPGLVATLAQACQMPTSLREQGKLLKSGGRFGRAGHQGAGSSQVLPSGSTRSKYATLSCHLYALLQGGQKGVRTGNPSVGGGVGGFMFQPLPWPLAVSVMPSVTGWLLLSLSSTFLIYFFSLQCWGRTQGLEHARKCSPRATSSPSSLLLGAQGL